MQFFSHKPTSIKQKPQLMHTSIVNNPRKNPELQKRVQQLPFLIKQYMFTDLIGQGSSCVVFKVHHRGYDKIFAAKMIPLGNNECGENEVRALSLIHHRNVIKLYDHFADGNFLILILDYCEKGTIRQVFRSGSPVPRDLLVSFMYDILSAVDSIHRCGIAHRDLKPSNIFLDSNSRPILADFGFSRSLNPEPFSSLKEEKYLCEFCGAYQYRPPEMILKQPHDPFKSDIWTLGITFFALAVGAEPFDMFSHEQVKESILNTPIVYPPCLDHDIECVLKRMLCTDPGKRPSPFELLQMSIFANKKDKYVNRTRSGFTHKSQFITTSMIVQSNRKIPGLNNSGN